jgi:hypothetical protein
MRRTRLCLAKCSAVASARPGAAFEAGRRLYRTRLDSRLRGVEGCGMQHAGRRMAVEVGELLLMCSCDRDFVV